jgi:hypothetical protein
MGQHGSAEAAPSRSRGAWERCAPQPFIHAATIKPFFLFKKLFLTLF